MTKKSYRLLSLEEFNEILNALLRTKRPSSDKVMPHDQMHWLKTLFSHICDSLRLLPVINIITPIILIKGVHQLTLHPTTLISLIDHFTIFNGWMHGQPSGPMCGSRIFVRGRGSRPDGQNTGSAHGTNTYVRTYTYMHTHTHAHIRNHTHKHVQTGT